MYLSLNKKYYGACCLSLPNIPHDLQITAPPSQCPKLNQCFELASLSRKKCLPNIFNFPTCVRPSTGTTPWLRRSTQRTPSTWQTSTTRVTCGSRRRWHSPPLPGATKNSSYIAALTQLSNLVLVKFSSDTVDVKHCSSV